MNFEKFKRRVALLLCALMVLGVLTAPMGVYADGDDAPVSATLSDGQSASGTGKNGMQYSASYDAEFMKRLVDAESYRKYVTLYKNVPTATDTVTITPSDLNEELTTATHSLVDASAVSDKHAYGGDVPTGKVLLTGREGNTVFDVDIPKTGMYSIRVTYGSIVDRSDTTEISTTIERMIYIDDVLPFSEARYIYFPRFWEYEYDFDADGSPLRDEEGFLQFPHDKNGNDTRPRRWEVAMWQTYYVRDWLGYEIDPLKFYFSEGHHQITFVSNREEMVIASIELYPYEEEPAYEDWLADMKAKGVEEINDVDTVRIQAENPTYISVQNIIPGNDRTSSLTEPQDPAVIKYNLLDNSTVNNWMKYKVTVPKTGLYSISFRFRQNSLIGMFTSRRLKVNGEVQFREASYLRFNYETGFQQQFATDGEEEKLLFYLEEGENTIELEIVLGYMVRFVYRIEQLIEELNDAYQTMLMITGPVPDTYRDYGFGRLCPEAVNAIAKGADTLNDIKKELTELTGETGDMSNALEMYSELFEKMARNEYEIAPNFITFKNYIISLSDWLYQALSQPLKLDYFEVGAVERELPRATATTLQRLGFEGRAFIASFSMDYTTIGFKDDASTLENDVIEMWAIADRESMLIQRYIVDNYFTPYSHISLRIKVITAGLTEAILAGIGPDVSFMDTVNTITWGMRTAILPLEEMDGFDELMQEFPSAMMDKLTMVGQDNIPHTYGIPTTLVFSMAFFRTDVLSELGLEIPDSWNDLYSVISTLGYNNLQVAIPTGLVGTELFLFQKEGGALYRDDGKCINLDTNVSLSAFKELCEMFTKYSSPIVYNDISRFRTGEFPIMIQEDAITIYNQLMTFYELRGMWQMTPVIGTLYEDGTVNRTTIANTNAMIMPRDGYDSDVVWQYVRWYCGSDSQTRQAREAIAVSQPTNKFSTANLSALLSQKWTAQEREAVTVAVNNLVGVPEYPGAYIVPTYVQFAFLNAYNQGMEPASAMLDEIIDINKEISRKRGEFGLEAYEVSYGNQVREQSEAAEASGSGN